MNGTNEPVSAFFTAVELMKTDIKLGINGECLRRDAEDLLAANNAVFEMEDLDPNVDGERCAAMQALEAPLLGRGVNLREMALEGA